MTLKLIRPSEVVEQCLADSASRWALLDDQAYRQLVESWLEAFGEAVVLGQPRRKGTRAMDAIERRLPADVLLFTRPPLSDARRFVSPTGWPCAYTVDKLRRIPAEALESFGNRELVLADSALSYCCLFNHEWNAFVPTEYYTLESI